MENILEQVLTQAENVLNLYFEATRDHSYSNDLTKRFEDTIVLINDAIELLSNIEEAPELSRGSTTELSAIKKLFEELEMLFSSEYKNLVESMTLQNLRAELNHTGPGRPKLNIPKDVLEELRGLNFSWKKISAMFEVSRWTVARRVAEYDLSHLQQFTEISDEEIDQIVRNFISRHGSSTGETFISGHFLSLGLYIQRRRIRASLNRVDPKNVALRWGSLVYRRKYYVPWPNSLWHIDGHHSLIRWKFVIHGCCDGFSRKIMFLTCNTNNLASTVLESFLQAVQNNSNLWPSRIRVDHGVENVSICDAMVQTRGEGRNSFLAGPSTRNQRIERLWRDVFRCVCHFFYYLFYGMEQSGILDLDNSLHMFALHIVFLQRINFALCEFKEMFNNHRLRTEKNSTPNQLWLEGITNPAWFK